MTQHKVGVFDTELVTGPGGRVKVRQYEPVAVGSENGWARIDDVYLRSEEDIVFGADPYTKTTATVEHLDSDSVMSIDLAPAPISAKVDMRFTKLQPEAPYRLYTGGTLAVCEGGRATGSTGPNGKIQFNKVKI